MDMKTKINMCFFMSMMFILIKIEIGIDINNDELFENTWECKRKNSWSSLVTWSSAKFKCA
jgi:hypothetical protein